ncbi:hypothetical protein PLICRDRAFT_114369 [Plicaturopsis crispa FD-325 SS-3]|nr:hypothetical protein PLICRDRAFT_114369 [Plicaturopsis crispa FD-325 SS-3]
MSALATCSGRRPFPFPSELSEHALTFCHARDVAAFSMTCHLAHALVYSSADQFIWRELFLRYPFDDPRQAVQLHSSSKAFDWRTELQRRIRAEFVAYHAEDHVAERPEALRTFIDAIRTARPTSAENDAPSETLRWVMNILRTSGLLETVATPPEIPLRSRLRTFLALALDDGKDCKTLARLESLRINSRCVVYDLRNYTRESLWGPFLNTLGAVHWVHVEAIMNVVSMNLSELPGVWVDTRPPIGLEATRAYSAPGMEKRRSMDWAGVEGVWRRYVSFMDYRDLFGEFHYSNLYNGPRDPSFFQDENFQEATRLIELNLRVITRDELFEGLDDTSGYFDFSDHGANTDAATKGTAPAEETQTVLFNEYPPLYFTGTSHGVNGNEATLKGCVRMCDDGVVRWRFTRKASVYDGHTQWTSEGVQLGNIASAAGVVGTWTGARHEQGDPVGPFWLWKVADDHPSHHASAFTFN